jgi:hypothetical protein
MRSAQHHLVCPVPNSATDCHNMDEPRITDSLLRRCGAVLEVATASAAVGRHRLSLLVSDGVGRRQADSAQRTRNVLAGLTRITVPPRRPSRYERRRSSMPDSRLSSRGHRRSLIDARIMTH